MGLRFLVARHALLRETPAFFPVSLFPLLFASIWISPFFWFRVKPLSRGISSWRILPSAWVCGAVLILVKRWARASRAAWTLRLPLPLLRFFGPALLCEDAEIPVRLAMRYRRWSTLLLLPLLWGPASAIFSLSEKGLFSLATLRLLILRGESRLVLFPGLQKLDVFSPICSSMLLLPGSQIFLVLGTAKHALQFARIHRAGFFLRRRLARRGDFRRLRQRRAQLRAKCESAPLRRSVTERGTRSTESLKKVKGYKVKKGNHTSSLTFLTL
jgi:hypothetical protein